MFENKLYARTFYCLHTVYAREAQFMRFIFNLNLLLLRLHKFKLSKCFKMNQFHALILNALHISCEWNLNLQSFLLLKILKRGHIRKCMRSCEYRRNQFLHLTSNDWIRCIHFIYTQLLCKINKFDCKILNQFRLIRNSQAPTQKIAPPLNVIQSWTIILYCILWCTAEFGLWPNFSVFALAINYASVDSVICANVHTSIAVHCILHSFRLSIIFMCRAHT